MPPLPDPIVLDPTGADHHGEAARLAAAGPVVPVLLPGGVPAWAITRHDLLARLLNDPRLSKDWHRWKALESVPSDWPLIGMVKVTNMVTADGPDHHRLRRAVTQYLTPARIASLTPLIHQTTADLLDALPGLAEDEAVDLRAHYALEVPLRTVCHLMGVEDHLRPELRHLVESIFSTTTPPQEVTRVHAAIPRLLDEIITRRRGQPGDDLTSALITARSNDPGSLSEKELADTIWLMLTAGHETTLSLITNATRALLTHPDQLALVKTGTATWEQVVEETLRWDAPIGNFIGRYPTEPITIAGITIGTGDAILAPYSLTGRDPAQHDPNAHLFDLNRAQRKHLAFGGGPHLCLGAGLARLQTHIALAALFARYPGLHLAVPDHDLTPVESLFSNSVQTLPVRLAPAPQER